jgi:hypothetical protein
VPEEYDMLSTSETTKMLRSRLLHEVVPELMRLGFRPVKEDNSPIVGKFQKFPIRYVRQRSSAIDQIFFHWDRYGRPKFMIQFRLIDHPVDIEEIRAGRPLEWWWYYGFYAYQAQGLSRLGFEAKWFGVGVICRVITVRSIDAAIKAVIERLNEIDIFLVGGKAAAMLRDDLSWNRDGLGTFHPPTRRTGN